MASQPPRYTAVVGSIRGPDLKVERALLRDGFEVIAGVDEVGRGSWAGPIVAAAVVLPLETRGLRRRLADVRDSKQVAADERLRLLPIIRDVSLAVGIGWASHHVIDREGLTVANRRAMQRAVSALSIEPQALIVDHMRLPDLPLHQHCIPRADERCLSVAAASIVAKVFRDRWMARCDSWFPGFTFSSHKGYGTHQHRDELRQQGPSSLHRRSFMPIVQLELFTSIP